MAYIEFSPGIKEIPTNVRILKSKERERSSAIFRFEDPQCDAQNILSMAMVDDEGVISCREVRAKFLNGEFKAIEVIYEMQTSTEWDRFMRFMERFSDDNEMGMD
ncbi:MAG: photosystem II reaction center protein Psb28 [Cyanophyceae cyanobacterium]